MTHPVTMLTTPLGTPASLKILVIYIAVSGVNSDGLRTTAQPVASAGAIFHDNIKRGWDQQNVSQLKSLVS